MTKAEIKEISEKIPAPIPVVETVDESGQIGMGFSKPIAVPTAANKTKMVGLLMEHNMIELNLTSGGTGKKIIGEPSFDATAFAPGSRRRLTESQCLPAVDEKLNDFFYSLENFESAGRGRKLATDAMSDDQKGFSWTVASFDRTGFKFKIKFNNEAFVSESG